MREVVAEQLERLDRRIEFNDGFELDIIAPNTWLAEWHARFELDERLGGRGDYELLELRLGPEDDVLEPGRRLAAAIQRTPGHRVLLVHVCDDGVSRERWQPFFRRFNEIRNAVVRDFRGNLVLLLAPRLVTDFAAEAPDVWSVAAVMVVGTWTREALLETMLDYVPALMQVAGEPPPAEVERVLTTKYDWRPALSRHSRAERAKQLLELLLGEAVDVAVHLNVPAEIPGNVAEILRDGFRLMSHPMVMGLLIDEDKIEDKDYLLTLAAAPFGEHPFGYAWISGGSLDILDPRLSAVRRCFTLICVPHRSARSRRWSVLRGTHLDAPVIAFPSDLAHPVVTLQRRGMGSVSLQRHRKFRALRPPAQLWLPHIEPRDLGTAQLYVPQ